MKIWMFYKLIPGLEPKFYAYTKEQAFAEMFETSRKNFYKKECDISKEKYKILHSQNPNEELQMHEFSTKSHDELMKRKVLQIVTSREILDIILHKDNIVMQMLSNFYIPENIFTEKFMDALNNIGYSYFKGYMNPPFYEKQENFDIPPFEFDVDELGLFMMLHMDDLKEIL